MTGDDVVSAVRRSDQALCEQISAWEALDVGVAFCRARFPALIGGNQLRDAWLANVDGPGAFDLVEAYYRRRGLTCLAWVPAPAQPPGPVEALLAARGWRRREHVAMGLAHWDGLAAPVAPGVRVLPARAMRTAFRATFAGGGGGAAPSAEKVSGAGETADAGVERLDDPNYDAFVAAVDGRAAGRIGYLEVGDIARLTDFFVAPVCRGRAVGEALAAHFLRMARRLSPRVVVASVDAGNEAGRGFLERWGFAAQGTLTEFHRPTGG